MALDLEKIAMGVRLILEGMGRDPNEGAVAETPDRVAAAYAEILAGVDQKAEDIVNVFHEVSYDEIVLVKDIPFYSMCEHHLLPFMGLAHVAYLPKGKVVGVSKLARVVELCSRRPQVQERLTSQIADLIMAKLDAKGAGIILEATHTCMTIRGVRKPGSVMVTSAMRGLFKSNLATRTEAINLLTGGRATMA